jgi:hypothetical protein
MIRSVPDVDLNPLSAPSLTADVADVADDEKVEVEVKVKKDSQP